MLFDIQYYVFTYDGFEFYIKPYSDGMKIMFCMKNGENMVLPENMQVIDDKNILQISKINAYLLNDTSTYKIIIGNDNYKYKRSHLIME